MRRWSLLALLLAAAGIVALILLWDAQRAHPPSLEAARSPSQASAVSVEQPLQSETAAQRASVAEPAETDPPTASESSSAHLSVRVLGRSSNGPVAKVRVIVSSESKGEQHGYKNVGGPKGDLESAPITGDDGIVHFDLPAARALRLRLNNEDERFRPRAMEFKDPGSESVIKSVSFDLGVPIHVVGQAGATDETSVLVPALFAGEERQLVLEIEDGLDGHVVGQVVDAETREPVAGARVRVLTGGQVRTEWHTPGPDERTTGNDGRFELSFALRASPLLCVESSDYGLRYVCLADAHGDAASPLVVHVSRAATLKVHVLDAAGTPIADASVGLDVTGYLLAHNEADAQGFFSNGLPVFPPDERWHAATGADGRAVIEGLPPRVDIRVNLEQNGRSVMRDPAGLRLQPGEVKEVEWRIGAGTLVQGLVLDQDGKPAIGVEIWALRAESAQRRTFLEYERERVVKKSITSPEGHFQMEDLLPGSWCIGPGAVRNGQIAPIAEAVELAGEPAREVNLHVFRGLYIRGRALCPNGEPCSYPWVQGAGPANDFIPGIQGGSDGSFSFGPLTPGAFTLTANASGRFAQSDPVHATAGDPDVVLQLKPGGTIRGHVIDAVAGRPCAAQLTIAPESEMRSQYAYGMQTSTQADGSFSIPGLEPALWSVVATTSDGQFGLQAHIEVVADAESGDLVLRLTPGGKVRLRYDGSHPRLFVKILGQGALASLGESVEKGHSIECLAPAGSLVIETRVEYSGPARKQSTELEAGETKDVVLKDED